MKKIIALFSINILFLTTITQLSAQDSFMFNDIKPLMAELSAPVESEIILSSESFRNSFTLYYEAEIVLEDWMLEPELIHNVTNVAGLTDLVRVQDEQEIAVESWMTDLSIDSDKLLARYILVEQEASIPLESWMLRRF